MTTKEALVDALRFGPMAQVMRGWDEQQRMWLCASIADDLLRDGWTRDASQVESGADR